MHGDDYDDKKILNFFSPWSPKAPQKHETEALKKTLRFEQQV
jgi:hypothetical protein